MHRYCGPGLALTLLLGTAQTVAQTAAAGLSLDEVVQQTLRGNPNIELQEHRVEASAGEVQAALGEFDPTFNMSAERSRDYTPLRPSEAAVVDEFLTDRTALRMDVSKPLRNGIVIGPEVVVSRIHGTEQDAADLEVATTGAVNFVIRAPLLRGWGEEVTGATLAVAELNHRAARYEFSHTVAQSVQASLINYWNYLFTLENLDIARESEQRVIRLEQQISRLVAADELPVAQLSLVRANLAEKIAQRASAEQALIAARQQLGLSLGLNYRAAHNLRPPSQNFPAVSAELLSQAEDLGRLVERGLEQRLDLGALNIRQEAAARAQAAARSALKPQFDLSLRLGYGNLVEGHGVGGYVDVLGDAQAGPNVGVTLSYQQPLNNNTARGQLRQQSAIYEQTVVQRRALAETIGANVTTAASQLLQSAAQVRESERSAALYLQSVEDESLRHRLGQATLIDVITVQDRYAAALLGTLQYRLNYATALAQLLFETGMLVVPGENTEGSVVRLDFFKAAS